MRSYKVGVGVCGVPLHFYTLSAKNLVEARSLAIRLYLNPAYGFDHLEVKPLKRGPAQGLVATNGCAVDADPKQMPSEVV